MPDSQVNTRPLHLILQDFLLQRCDLIQSRLDEIRSSTPKLGGKHWYGLLKEWNKIVNDGSQLITTNTNEVTLLHSEVATLKQTIESESNLPRVGCQA